MIIINTTLTHSHFLTTKTETFHQPAFLEKQKNMKIPSIFKNRDSTKLSLSEWPSCKHPKTVSFRKQDDMFKTVNSVFFDIGSGSGQESWFTNSSESASYSTESEDQNSGEDSLESIVRGVRTSQRLFFEPVGGNSITSSILEEEEDAGKCAEEDEEEEEEACGLRESVVLAMESEDPYVDFKKSMEEMVESNGLKDWDSLEELLGWYLKMNGKNNHGFIVAAFVDLLLAMASSDDDDDSSFLSASSSFSSPPSSPLSSPAAKTETNVAD